LIVFAGKLMNNQKITKAMERVYNHIQAENHKPISQLAVKAKDLIKEHYPEIPNFDINIGYAEGFQSKLFYMGFPRSKQFLVYCPVLGMPFELTKISTFKKKALDQCQTFMLARVKEEDLNHIELLMKSNTDQMRLVTSTVACYDPKDDTARQVFKEILEDCYAEAIIGK
jgi:hypothetical protein